VFETMLDVYTSPDHWPSRSSCKRITVDTEFEATEDSLQELESRVAGHESIRRLGSKVLKFVGQKKRAVSEIYFYETKVDHIPGLRLFVPHYLGTVKVAGRGDYIALEDLTATFKKPSIIDFKIGTSVSKEHHDEERRLRKIAKFPLQQKIGFRVSGARIYCEKTGEYYSHDGHTFRNVLNEQNVVDVIQNYLFFNGERVRTELLQLIVPKLKALLGIMEKNSLYRFVSSSLLIIYEGEESEDDPRVEVKMIDFVHVYDLKESEKDESYIKGLTNLILFFESVAAQA
jgi:1D-myo-inositol-tetrakisphosphate 5-kinase/inositol-polyphosphate multikinase